MGKRGPSPSAEARRDVYAALAQILQNDLVDADGKESRNWHYCDQKLEFQHKAACEFLFYVADTWEEREEEADEMRAFGCSEEFIKAIDDATKAGAEMILFHA